MLFILISQILKKLARGSKTWLESLVMLQFL